jgi:hypothetical protein
MQIKQNNSREESMKLTPVLLGISLVTTTLSATLIAPAQANEYQANRNRHSPVKTYKTKKFCFVKRFYVPGSYDNRGYYHEGYWAVKKVCEFRQVRH